MFGWRTHTSSCSFGVLIVSSDEPKNALFPNSAKTTGRLTRFCNRIWKREYMTFCIGWRALLQRKSNVACPSVCSIQAAPRNLSVSKWVVVLYAKQLSLSSLSPGNTNNPTRPECLLLNWISCWRANSSFNYLCSVFCDSTHSEPVKLT